MEKRYIALGRFVLKQYDFLVQQGDDSDRVKGEIEGLRTVLNWMRGYEQADLEGLREMLKGDS